MKKMRFVQIESVLQSKNRSEPAKNWFSVALVWTHFSMVEPHSSNFSVITTNVLGVRIFRKFTVQ